MADDITVYTKYKLRNLLGYTRPGEVSYEQLVTVQKFLLSKFTYVPDQVQFEKVDFWSTKAYDNLLKYGVFQDDCDGFGYSVIELLHEVFEVPKDRLFRVSCAAETGEGHFVAWVKSSHEGVLYQLENRVQVPRSLRYMHNLGYKYWHYSDMNTTDKWYDAEKAVANIIYNTPVDLKSDKPVFTIQKALSVHKSDTLKVGWIQIVTGFVSTMLPWLQNNEDYLERVISTESVGILMILLGFTAVFLRTVTHEDIDMKKDEDAKLHKS